MALVEAYFDESGTHDGSDILCVAGYIFEKEKAVALDYEWQLMLKDYGLPYFHMKACAHNDYGIYAHLSRPECDEAARRAIGLIKEYAAQGIAISIEVKSFPLIPLYERPHTVYSFACTQVIHGIRKWADESNYKGDVAYFFETGAKGRGIVEKEMGRIFCEHNLKLDFRYESHTFIEKKRATPLQCADMLAWHWYTYNKKKLKGEKPMRKDFKNLIEKRIDAHHYDKESIELWLANNQEAPKKPA